MDARRERLWELGQRLRGLRSAAGLSGVVLSGRAGVAQQTVSKVERGLMLPSPDLLSRLADGLGVDEPTRTELLSTLTGLERELERTRSAAGPVTARQESLARRERTATALCCFQHGQVPALLQTPEYAAGAFAASWSIDPDDLTAATAARLARQQVLYDSARSFHFVVTESALRTWPGSPAVVPGQLDRLAVAAGLPNVRLGVIPWDTHLPEHPLHGFTLLDDKTVIVETFTADLALTAPDDLAVYQRTFATFADAAVYGDDARAVFVSITRDLPAPQ